MRAPHLAASTIVAVACVAAACRSTPPGVCSDACVWAHDGVCDDGSEGAIYNVCAYGTDCSDCGARRDTLAPTEPPGEERGPESTVETSCGPREPGTRYCGGPGGRDVCTASTHVMSGDRCVSLDICRGCLTFVGTCVSQDLDGDGIFESLYCPPPETSRCLDGPRGVACYAGDGPAPDPSRTDGAIAATDAGSPGPVVSPMCQASIDGYVAQLRSIGMMGGPCLNGCIESYISCMERDDCRSAEACSNTAVACLSGCT